MLRKLKRAIIRGNNSGHYLHEAWRQRMLRLYVAAELSAQVRSLWAPDIEEVTP